jgi:hypothetical protein
VLITEIPPTTTTDSLIASIEDATRKGKLKVKSINDFTSETVEIEIKCPAGVDAEKLVDALYAFTDCEVSITSRIVVIKDNRPVELTVSEMLRENTEQLVAILKRELELREKELLDELHYRTLERIFIEERIYKRSRSARRTKRFSAVFMRVSSRSRRSWSATSWTRTWKNFCRSASAAFRCSTSTSTARRWRRRRPTWTRRARISRGSRNTSSAISKRCWKNTARNIRA